AMTLSSLVVLALLAAVGYGWARTVVRDAVDAAALAPVFGVAALMLVATAFDRVGLRLGAWWVGTAASALAGLGGYLAWSMGERPRHVPREQDWPEEHEHQQGPQPRAAEFERRGRGVDRRAPDRAHQQRDRHHERHRERDARHDPQRVARRRVQQPPEESRGRQPALVPGELEHPERGVMELEERCGERDADRGGEASTREERAPPLA